MSIENGKNRDELDMANEPESVDGSWMSAPLERDDEFKSSLPEIKKNIEAKPEAPTLLSLFSGENAEVTVKRSNGQLEGGWICEGPAIGKNGYMIVHSREKGAVKTVKIEELLEIQPFKVGDTASLIKSNGTLDLEWKVAARLSGDNIGVDKIEKSERKERVVKKHDLIMAKIMELEIDRDNLLKDDKDTGIIDSQLLYWNQKIKVIKELNEKPDTDNEDESDDPYEQAQP